MRLCDLPGCDRKHWARGLCNKHYLRETRPKQGFVPRPVVTVNAAHARVRKLWGSASSFPCIACGEQARDWAYDGTDPAQGFAQGVGHSRSWQFYSSWPEFYMPMCRGCHSAKDRAATVEELREYRAWKHQTGLSLTDLGGAPKCA